MRVTLGKLVILTYKFCELGNYTEINMGIGMRGFMGF
jgi:hypothetical protein